MYNLEERDLIKPEELLTLPEGTSIVKLLRQQPAKVHQVEYWKDPSYIMGEQKISTKWNPNVFTFDVDGYYDIADRCRNDAMYKIDTVKTFTLKEVRGYDLTTAFASVCTSQCMPGNSQAEQTWELGSVAAGDMMQVDLHLAPMVEAATTFPVEFTFSDGTDNVTFTVKYNYIPVAE